MDRKVTKSFRSKHPKSLGRHTPMGNSPAARGTFRGTTTAGFGHDGDEDEDNGPYADILYDLGLVFDDQEHEQYNHHFCKNRLLCCQTRTGHFCKTRSLCCQTPTNSAGCKDFEDYVNGIIQEDRTGEDLLGRDMEHLWSRSRNDAQKRAGMALSTLIPDVELESTSIGVGPVDGLLENCSSGICIANASDLLMHEILGEKVLETNPVHAVWDADEQMDRNWLAKFLEVPVDRVGSLRWADVN